MGKDSRSDPRFIAVFLTQTAILWLALAGMTALLFTTVPGTAWSEVTLSPKGRLSLLQLELLLLIPAAAGLAVLTAWATVSRRTISGRGTAVRLARNLLVAIAIGAGLLLVVSWLSFRSTGTFLDPVGVRFWLADPIQILQHVAQMEPRTLLILPAAALIAVGAYWLLARGTIRSGRRQAVIAATALLMVTIWAWTGAAAGPATGVAGFYQATRADRTGPITHLTFDIARRIADEPPPIPPAKDIAIVNKPILPMERYIAGIDSERVHRRNVIVLIVESLRDDQLRVGGSQRSVMPTVDAIAREGRTFRFHYTQSSHSNYADMAPLSSHYPLRSESFYVYPEHPSYPRVLLYDILKPLGYSTAVFSSQNENWGGMIHYLKTGNLDRFLHAETFEGPTVVPHEDDGFAKFVKGTKRSGKIDDRFTVGEAIEWIDSLNGRPFFIYMNLQNSHTPYDVPADFAPRFGSGKTSFPIRFGSFPRDSADAVIDKYANSLAYVDAQIARLVEHLARRGIWDETILVVTGDTGQAFFEHGFAAHAGPLYDEVMRVPLIFRAPSLRPGIDDRPAQHIDVPPSILHLLGLPPHPAYQGIDLFGPAPPPDRSLYLVAQSPLAHQYAIVRDGHKLLYDARRREYLLYDLVRDPGETVDLSRSLPEETRQLGARLHAWQQAQVAYYKSWIRHSRSYPPVLVD